MALSRETELSSGLKTIFGEMVAPRTKPATFDDFEREVRKRERTETTDSGVSEISFFPDPDIEDDACAGSSSLSACLCGAGVSIGALCEQPCSSSGCGDVDDEAATVPLSLEFV